MTSKTLQFPHLNVFDTLQCGQVFRFNQVDGSTFRLISTDKMCLLTQQDDKVILTSEHIDYFTNYLDLSTDYQSVYRELSRFDELKDKLSYGIHILRQDLLECIISFIISANNNIPRIQSIIEKMSAALGKNMGEYYAFPTLDSLTKASVEDFKGFGAGYRAGYLFDAVKLLAGTDIIERLKTMDYPESVKALMSIKGVGRKVADCVCLFALYHTSCYPADTWIEKADGCNAATARQLGMERYKELAGYAQQLRFYAAREQGRQKDKNHSV